jgi:hypothetical protein
LFANNISNAYTQTASYFNNNVYAAFGGGLAVGGAAGYGVGYGLAALSTACLPCGAVAGAGMLGYSGYQLASDNFAGAQNIYNSFQAVGNGSATPGQAFMAGSTLGGIIGGTAGGIAGGSANGVVLNIGGEGKVAGAINIQGSWILDSAWRSSATGGTLADLQAAGNQFVVADKLALPFADSSVSKVITNSVPIDANTWLGAGVQSSEVWRVIGQSGSWINNGVKVIGQ